MNPRFAVVGSINQDIVFRSMRVPNQGETVFGDAFTMSPGGKGANQAVALARLNLQVSMIGCVGSDTFGRDLTAALVKEGVATDGLFTVPGSTGAALVQVGQGGENRITLVPGANAALGSEHLEQHWNELAQAAMVLTQLETPMPTTIELARRCKAAGISLMLDPAPAERLSPELLQAVTWLTPNLSEAQVLLGSKSTPTTIVEARNMAERLLDRGPKGVLLKLGAMGSAAVRRGEVSCFQPGFRVRVKDTTAAGDAANAAFAAAVVRGDSVPEALRFSNAAGALCASRAGAQGAMPSQAEVESFLSSNPVTNPAA